VGHLVRQIIMETIYNSICDTFDKTRHSPWPCVLNFLNALPSGSKILDVGCGNGRHLSIRDGDCDMYGCDISANMIEKAKSKNKHVEIRKINTAASLPYPDNYFDGLICIAVIHHIVDKYERERAILEMQRVVKPGGKILITVWSTEAIKPTWKRLSDSSDYLVPWNGNKSAEKNDNIYLRFYHMFNKYEIMAIKNRFHFDIVSFEAKNWQLVSINNKTFKTLAN
jgi:ubiquinone/menaquinone biosynthesis C-methylase UbiE